MSRALSEIEIPRRGPGGDRKASLVASAEAKAPEKQKKERKALFPCPPQEICFLWSSIRFNRWAPKVSKGRPESPLVASAEAKPSSKEGPFPCLPQKSCSSRTPLLLQGDPKVSKGRPESPLAASAEAKPSSQERPFPLPSTKKLFLPHPLLLQGDPKVSKGRPESPLVASAEAKPSAKQRKARKLFSLAFHKKSVSCGRFRPPAGGRGTFPHGKVPKGCRGRPKGACLMAAPGPPVAKQQCTASLAGARPAGFTSVPGRATVAFGAADPSPGSPAPDYPWSVGKGPPRQNHLCSGTRPGIGAMQGACPPRHPIGCGPQAKPNGVPDTDPVGRETRGTYPFRYKGGPGVSLGRLKGV